MPSLADARNELQAKLTHQLSAAFKSAAPAPVILVRAPGGIGKTHLLAQLLHHKRVVWFGERNAMLEQLAQFLTTPLPNVQPLTGPSGGEIERRPAKKDDGMCSQLDKRIAPVRARGLARFEATLACARCPDRDACTYRNWRPSKPWLFVPHMRLGLSQPMGPIFADRDVVVIDESPLSTLLASVTLGAPEIREIVQTISQTSTNTQDLGDHTIGKLGRLFEVIADLLDDPPPGRRRVELRRIAEDLGLAARPTRPSQPVTCSSTVPDAFGVAVAAIENAFGAATALSQSRVPAIDIKLDSLVFALQKLGLRDGLARKVVELFEALALDTNARATCVVVLPEHGRHHGAVVAGRLIRPPIPSHVPLIVLDATAELLPYVALFPKRAICTIDVRADMQATVMQLSSNRYPAVTLRNQASFDRLMRAVDRYKRTQPTRKVALVMKREVQQRFHKRLTRSGFRSEDVFQFWALRGINDLSVYDALFIFGAPEIDPFEVEGMSRALMSVVPIEPDETPFDYTPIESPNKWATVVRELHGTPVQLPDRGFDRAGPDVVFWALHQAEYVQTILRLRPYDPRNKGKLIVFMSNVSLPLVNTELVDEKELTDGGPPGLLRLIAAAERLRSSTSATAMISQRELALCAGVTEGRVSQILNDPKTRTIWSHLLEELRKMMQKTTI